jgi:hypothetical protein
MEPHREDQATSPPPGAEQRPKRFRIVKLEERIAPSKGGGHTGAPQCGPIRTNAPPCQPGITSLGFPCW